MGVLLVTGLRGVKRRGKQTEGAGGGQTQKTRLQHFLTQYLANISQIPSTFLFSGSFFFLGLSYVCLGACMWNPGRSAEGKYLRAPI